MFTCFRSKARNIQRKRDYEPTTWKLYFDTSEDIKIDLNTFHVFTRGTEGPTLVLLHGGGYSALTWAEFAVQFFSNFELKILFYLYNFFIYNDANLIYRNV